MLKNRLLLYLLLYFIYLSSVYKSGIRYSNLKVHYIYSSLVDILLKSFKWSIGPESIRLRNQPQFVAFAAASALYRRLPHFQPVVKTCRAVSSAIICFPRQFYFYISF